MTASHLRDPALDPILAAIKSKGVAHLDAIHRSRLMERIIQSTMKRVMQHDLFHFDADKKPVATDLSPFTDEDEALATIVSSMQWSERFHDFFVMNAKKLGLIMAKEQSLQSFINHLSNADSTTKLNAMKSMAAKQLDLFKHDGLTPQAPEIIISDKRETYAATFARGAKPLSLKAHDKTITISNNVVEPGNTVHLCQTVWHEHVHSLCQQFAASCHAGILSPTNPFYADARMKQARLVHGTSLASGFTKAYAADPEEKLAYLTQDVFIDSWVEHSRWGARFARALRIG